MTATFCPFCSPAFNEACFAQSMHFNALYNLAPILPGHCLIVPKEHWESIMNLEESVLIELVSFCRRVIKTLQTAFQTNAFDWTLQEGEAAGQTIAHLHIHIIPRKLNDLPEPGDWYPKLEVSQSNLLDSFSRPRYSSDKLAKIAAHLKEIYQLQNPKSL